MTEPILLCGFNDQSDPSIGIVINEVDGAVMYQNGNPPKLSGGTCDFTNPYTSYTYLPADKAGSFSLTSSAPKLTVEATVTLTSASNVISVGKSGRGYYSVPNWEVGIIDSKLMIVGGSSGTPSVGPGTIYCHAYSAAMAVGPHHIAAVFDGVSVKGYIDGVLVISATCSSMPADPYPGELYLGAQPDQPPYPARGVIVDEIRITRDVVYSGPFTPPAPGSMSSYVYPTIPTQQVVSLTPCFRVFVGNGNDIPVLKDYGFIEGTVKNSGIPASDQRVACFDNKHNLIDEVRSGFDGSYRFNNLPRLNSDTYVVMARDSNGLLSPATADNRIPEAYS